MQKLLLNKKIKRKVFLYLIFKSNCLLDVYQSVSNIINCQFERWTNYYQNYKDLYIQGWIY